ncbi:flagellar basal body-associated FliL family protein [Rheinheimera sp. 1928-s]|uniref:flagellar basal body-associated FliL family protein n=1 Tax=Rheinheimera sp. 1928-s TaxID=3033803 RepID=UPI002603AD67|nr:flagellar basal body-associated FliL family protein [Rheinheimera sp. 1928-s]MDF3125151.1 flagellar basal body-associated FliL family protein [Rheinheimera sp. 1928-s]
MNKMVVLLGVLLVGALGTAGFFWFQAEQSKTAVQQVSVKPLFFPMEKFVMSVNSDPNSRYLVLELTLVTHKPDTVAALKEATPLLRNAMVEHFAKSSHLEVKLAMQQIEEVQKLLLGRFNQTLADNKFDDQLDNVLITNIFIQ